MWPKRFGLKRFAAYGLAAMLGLSTLGLAQPVWGQFQNYNTLDPSTQKSLDELNRMLLSGTDEQIQAKLNSIISNAGYIKALASVYYRLAQNEEEGQRVIQHYQVILSNWPDSAWAQKAVAEVVPLYLMSDGRLGQPFERLIWEHIRVLMSPAEDAASIGEDPEILQAALKRQLINLAYYKKDMALVKNIDEMVQAPVEYPEKVELMLAYDLIQQQDWDQARNRINTWLQQNQDSDLMPFALMAMYQCAQDQAQRVQIISRLEQEYPNAIETQMLQRQLQ